MPKGLTLPMAWPRVWGFEAWQTVPLNALKSRVPWLDWLLDIAERRCGGLGEFGSLANGTLECPKKKCHGWTGSWTLPKGVAEGWGSLEAWQTAPLNALKRSAMAGLARGHCQKAWRRVGGVLKPGKRHP